MKFKNDKYRKVRGGWTRFLEIHCQKCGEHICKYQKDGPGNLRRVYLDRIFEPKVIVSKKDLSCTKGHILGVKIVYEKREQTSF